MSSKDTIVALSSGRPPAAIAVIRLSGPQAHSAARALAGDLPAPRQAAVRELRAPGGGELLDEALVLRFDGPNSTTGEDVVELHCHGGRAVVAAVLDALRSADGVREAEPGEFTRRAFANGRIDLTEAEGLADLLEAETQSQRRAALALADGGLRRMAEAWRERLLAASALAELAIDYVDEDEAPVGANGLRGVAGALADNIGQWLERPRIEPLRDGVRVVIAGPPNSGKSSLLNMLVGYERAIVADVPGTTRDHVDVPIALGGVPVVLTDTAGIRETNDAVEGEGVARAEALKAAADVLLWLGGPTDAPAHPRLIRVRSKADLPGRAEAPPGSLAVSAVTRTGVDALVHEIRAQAATLLPGDDGLALNARQARHLEQARADLEAAGSSSDPLLQAEHLRGARLAFDQLTGQAGVEDFLDALFGRFCLGK